MRKRTATAAAVVTALAGAAWGVFGAGANYSSRSDPSRCAISENRSQHTVAANSFGRVWERHRTEGRFRVTDTFACSNRSSDHIRIATTRIGSRVGDPFSSVEVSEDSINATYVAFVRVACPTGSQGTCSYDLIQRRVKDRRLVRHIESETPIVLERPLVFGAGQLAYGKTVGECDPCEVHTVTDDGDTVVDTGRNIVIRSMSLATDGQGFGMVTWLNGNDARAAIPGTTRQYE
jgi:hypothetical protein